MTIQSKITKKTLAKIANITGSELTLGKLLWAIRKSEDCTQMDFAKKLGISKQHLCDVEHGRKTISPKLAAEYARKLGFSEEQFIRLSLQDMVDRAGLKATVAILPIKHSKKSMLSRLVHAGVVSNS